MSTPYIRAIAERPLTVNRVTLFGNELTPVAFGAHLQGMMLAAGTTAAERAAGRFGLLVIEIGRSDRGSALAGLPGGVEVLAQIRKRIADVLRADDRYTVVGADDILVIIPGIGSEAIITLAAHRIQNALTAPLDSPDPRVRLRPAIGCALYPDHRSDPEGLMTAADEARGRARTAASRIAVFRNIGRTELDHALVEELRTALNNNELEVWLQPQIDVKRAVCTSAEALIRWPRPPDKTPVHAGMVAEMAEANGMMPALTQFVINAALRHLKRLDEAGIFISIGINLSASGLADTSLPRQVAYALSTWDVPASRLTLEVTESSIMADFEGALAVMLELKKLGARLSIDDFGTGYSSLAYLRRMPLDELKIDQVFVRNIMANPGDVQITRSVIDLSHNFGLEAVAEGVETAEARDLLIGFGCDILQGYYFSKPITVTQLIDWWPTQHGLMQPS